MHPFFAYFKVIDALVSDLFSQTHLTLTYLKSFRFIVITRLIFTLFVIFVLTKSNIYQTYQVLSDLPTGVFQGAVAYSGATMDWLRYRLELYTDHAVGDELAKKALLAQHGSIDSRKSGQLANLKTLDACYLVPAFSGLFCPYWREDARGVIAGFDESCTRGDLIAAGYRASAYQTQEVLQAACETTKGPKRSPPRVISVDGGLTKSEVFMQSLADLTGSVIIRPNKSDVMTALGAAVVAAIAVGIDPTGLVSIRNHAAEEEEVNTFRPGVTSETRDLWMKGYRNAVKRSLNWQTDAVNGAGDN